MRADDDAIVGDRAADRRTPEDDLRADDGLPGHAGQVRPVGVRERGAEPTRRRLAQGGRLSALSKDGRGNESMTEYPVAPGKSLILEDEFVHQTYFVVLGKRSGTVQVIEPRGAHRVTLTLAAIGLEPVDDRRPVDHGDALFAGQRPGST